MKAQHTPNLNPKSVNSITPIHAVFTARGKTHAKTHTHPTSPAHHPHPLGNRLGPPIHRRKTNNPTRKRQHTHNRTPTANRRNPSITLRSSLQTSASRSNACSLRPNLLREANSKISYASQSYAIPVMTMSKLKSVIPVMLGETERVSTAVTTDPTAIVWFSMFQTNPI